jgi:carbonic anhydrase
LTDTHDLSQRNSHFAQTGFVADLAINPSGNMMVVGCVDPRVDPAHVLGLGNGEAAIIRNVGGRITTATLRTMAMLSNVGQANTDTRRPGIWNLVILHHTDCGLTDLASFPELLADYFEITIDELGAKSVNDPVGSVRGDVEIIKSAITAKDFLVSGLVDDVDTGLVEIVVPQPKSPRPSHATCRHPAVQDTRRRDYRTPVSDGRAASVRCLGCVDAGAPERAFGRACRAPEPSSV